MGEKRRSYPEIKGRLYPDMPRAIKNLYTIWAEEHGVVLTDIVITRKKGVKIDNPFQDPNEIE